MGRGERVHPKGEETDTQRSPGLAGAAVRGEGFPVSPAPSMVAGVGLLLPRTAGASAFTHQSPHLLGSISCLSLLLVEGSLECGSKGGGPALLHGSPQKGMSQTLPLPSRGSQTVREEIMTEHMPQPGLHTA